MEDSRGLTPHQPEPNPEAAQVQIISQSESETQTDTSNQQGVKSSEYPGLLITPDGTYIMTPQFKTWHKMNNAREGKAPCAQLEKHYQNSTDPNWVHPIGFPSAPKLDKSWHPQVSSLCLEYSYEDPVTGRCYIA